MKKIILILFLFCSGASYSQVTNGGFEVWDTVIVSCYDTDLVSLYAVPNPEGGIVNSWDPYWGPGAGCGIGRTTDSYSGNYSLLLFNWYNYAYGWVVQTSAINYRPQYLEGYFKYITGGNEVLSYGTAKVFLTRFNGASNDTIGTGTFEFNSSPAYSPFQMTINYTSSLTPDSISFDIKNGAHHCLQQMVCNLLYLDDLSLSGIAAAFPDVMSEQKINVFPNPAVDEIKISREADLSFTCKIYSALGEPLIEKELQGRESALQISSLSDGFYFYEIHIGNTMVKKGKLVKQ
jgi:hypothetical protein